jgi:hypothetical protein
MASQVVSWRMDSIKIVRFQSNLESAKIGVAPKVPILGDFSFNPSTSVSKRKSSRPPLCSSTGREQVLPESRW